MNMPERLTEKQRPMRADARRNYERLLAAAAGVFAEQGAGASLEEIAGRAGVGIGTLYRHFPNRQALLEAVYREHIEALAVEADTLLNAPSPGEALFTWLNSVLFNNMAQRGLKEALMREGGTEVTAACKQQLMASGTALLNRAQQAGAVRRDLDMADLMRLLYGLVLAAELASDGPEQVSRLLALMLEGIRNREPAER